MEARTFSVELPPAIGRGVRIFIAVCLGPIVGLLFGALASTLIGELGLGVGLVFFGFFAWWVLRKSPPTIVTTTIDDERLVLQRGQTSSEMRWGDLANVLVFGNQLHLSSTGGQLFVIPLTESTTVLEEIRDRVARHPRSVEVFARIRQFEIDAAVQSQQPTPLIHSLLVLIGVGFLIELRTGAFDDLAALLRLGANFREFTFAGELDRLVAANFLHGSVMHLVMNGSAILQLGLAFERWAGSARLGVLTFVSGISGMLAAALATPDRPIVGISTVVWGLLGALLVTSVAFRRIPSLAPKLRARDWASLLVINGLINLLPNISFAGHAGGFVGGIGAALLLYPTPNRPGLVSQRLAMTLGAVAAALTLTALVVTTSRALA